MKTIALIISLWMLLPLAANGTAASPEIAAHFHAGNSEYQKGNYPAAEQRYRRILDSGIENGIVYYNLGNACFKQKRLGDAIYYWEKARPLLPNDRELRENLELANLMRVDRVEAPADPLPLRIVKKPLTLLSLPQEAGLALIVFILANIAFFAYQRIGNARIAWRAFIASIVLGGIFLLLAGSLAWKSCQKEYRKEAIVVAQKVDVRSGPGTENLAVFTIHEGIKVRVHESNNGWHQISLPNGWSGWLHHAALRIL